MASKHKADSPDLLKTLPSKDETSTSSGYEILILRFWRRVDKNGPIHPVLKTRCWLWKNIPSHCYGGLWVQGKQEPAHRFSWKVHFGEIPKGLLVCHNCDIPACVNPDHLFVGTYLDNNTDRSRKGRSATGEKNGNSTHPEKRPRGSNHGRAKLTEEIIREIRANHKPRDRRWGTLALARKYGVTECTIRFIVSGRYWRHV